MFTECRISARPQLDAMIRKLLQYPEFAELRDNGISVGIFAFHNDTPINAIGRINVATEFERKHGWDVLIYLNDYPSIQLDEVDIEAYVYQLLLTVEPSIVGQENICIIKINKERGIQICPETVQRYGRDIRWYKGLYGEQP